MMAESGGVGRTGAAAASYYSKQFILNQRSEFRHKFLRAEFIVSIPIRKPCVGV